MQFRTLQTIGRTWLRWKPSQYPTYYSFQRPASTTSSARFDFQSIDAKWHRRWKDAPNKPKRVCHGKSYILPMFPYPSGTLHLGHLRVYTISDVLTRFKHMQGFDVLHPMGWDAFGLPAENAAIERGVDPAEWTRHNIAKMKEQLMAMGASFDWSREFMTCDPSFYQHTQRIFLMLYERGLAYQAEAMLNYDPVDRTVLANEQVDSNGFSWRSGAKVEKIRLKQWFLRITSFRESLLTDLDNLAMDNRWPNRVLSMQRNWLGRSSGAKFRFQLTMSTGPSHLQRSVEVFTTRPDTLYGVQYLALSTTHPIVEAMARSLPELQAFIDTASTLPPDSKVGYLLPDVEGINPLALLKDQPEIVQKSLPVYAAPYVLGDYGEGAVMGVPGHDTRDHAFWRQNRGSESIPLVVEPPDTTDRFFQRFLQCDENDVPFIPRGILTPICGTFSGLSSSEASRLIIANLKEAGQHAEIAESWRLRDWLISRQRYWGTPIPMVNCKLCGTVPVPMNQLPVELPKVDESWLRGKGGNPLEDAEHWVNTTCPSCGGHAKRDTDTMDTFVDSSWYYARFADPHNTDLPFSPSSAETHLPVDIYIGGVEHAILHLLYARFMTKFLATTELWPSGDATSNKVEPFRKLITQGMVHGKTYSDPTTGRFLKPEEVDLSDPTKPKIRAAGEVPNVSWEKMSKSKYNGVDPTQCIWKYGADATRAHILFQAPIGEVLEWDEEKIVGIQRWFGRVWRVVEEITRLVSSPDHKSADLALSLPAIWDFSDAEAHIWAEVQRTIESVTQSLDRTYSLNTVVSDLIKLTNTLYSSPTTTNISPAIHYYAASALLRMMAPLTPAFAEECWECLHSSLPSSSYSRSLSTTPSNEQGERESIFTQPFPTLSPSKAISARRIQPCAVQENGKLRFAVEIPNPPAHLLEDKSEDKRALESWVLNELGRTVEGKRWFEGKGWSVHSEDGRVDRQDGAVGEGRKTEGKWKRIIVVKGGRTVNFVD
ncbi:MAG: Leucyl-tRNA synthetase, mitochondrial [Pleopsidium flavum]|nr:MAG: Leucyl-tRNA synthetase, mitochondrial [Pleopsidium flavum]